MALRSRRMSIRSRIYDWFLLPLTSRWYGEVLKRLSPGARLLDIGIGTGGALAKHAELLKSRGFGAAAGQRVENVLAREIDL